MQINMTLVVQAGHFLLAYVILKRFLLRPVFGVIEQETMQADALIETIKSRTIVVQEKTRENNERWARYQQEMRAQMPPIEHYTPLLKDIAPTYTPIIYSPEYIKAITKDVATALTEKVKHVI